MFIKRRVLRVLSKVIRRVERMLFVSNSMTEEEYIFFVLHRIKGLTTKEKYSALLKKYTGFLENEYDIEWLKIKNNIWKQE